MKFIFIVLITISSSSVFSKFDDLISEVHELKDKQFRLAKAIKQTVLDGLYEANKFESEQDLVKDFIATRAILDYPKDDRSNAVLTSLARSRWHAYDYISINEVKAYEKGNVANRMIQFKLTLAKQITLDRTHRVVFDVTIEKETGGYVITSEKFEDVGHLPTF